jgi:hypothetical protein
MTQSNDMLTKEEEKFLKEKIEDWMDHDIEAMISGKCNVSCATLLGIFMEVLGGIAEGTLNELGREKDRFQAFLRLPWLPRQYRSLDSKLSRERSGDGLYEIFRCNLVHTFFFGGLDIKNNPEKPLSRCCPDNIPGIREADDGSGRLIIHVNDLAYDIKKARDHLLKEIREKNNKYRSNFRKLFTTI